MRTERLQYFHDVSHELAKLAEASGLSFLAYVYRMAELEAKERLAVVQEEQDATATGRRIKAAEGVPAN